MASKRAAAGSAPARATTRTASARVRARATREITQAPPRRAPIVASATQLAYESTSIGRRAAGWRPPSLTPNPAILNGLALLRDRSRAAVRNDGYAKAAIDELVSNIIGTGIKPLSQADRVDFRKRAQDLWLAWTDESDADGLLDWYGQQEQATRAWFEGGEVFARIRPRLPSDGLSVPMQVQIIEPELCPHNWNTLAPGTGNRIRAGIEFNPIGQRVAYWFFPSRPGDLQDYDPSQLKRLPAENVIHLFKPLRPGQLRGVPHLTQALIRLHELDKIDDAVVLRHQLANLFVAFLTHGSAVDTGVMDPLTGVPVQQDADGNQLLPMEPGLFQELAPGEDVSFSQPPAMDTAYPDFTKQQLRAVAVAAGVPYELLTGDLSAVNDRSVRVLLQGFRRRVMAWQHQIVAFQLCRRVWRAWMDRAFLSGALPLPASYQTDPLPWTKAKWIPQGWPYINPVQDVEAQKDAIRSGLTSRSTLVSEQGEDAEDIDAQQAADNQRADRLQVKYDSDGRQPAAGPRVTEPNAPLPPA